MSRSSSRRGPGTRPARHRRSTPRRSGSSRTRARRSRVPSPAPSWRDHGTTQRHRAAGPVVVRSVTMRLLARLAPVEPDCVGPAVARRDRDEAVLGGSAVVVRSAWRHQVCHHRCSTRCARRTNRRCRVSAAASAPTSGRRQRHDGRKIGPVDEPVTAGGDVSGRLQRSPCHGITQAERTLGAGLEPAHDAAAAVARRQVRKAARPLRPATATPAAIPARPGPAWQGSDARHRHAAQPPAKSSSSRLAARPDADHRAILARDLRVCRRFRAGGGARLASADARAVRSRRLQRQRYALESLRPHVVSQQTACPDALLLAMFCLTWLQVAALPCVMAAGRRHDAGGAGRWTPSSMPDGMAMSAGEHCPYCPPDHRPVPAPPSMGPARTRTTRRWIRGSAAPPGWLARRAPRCSSSRSTHRAGRGRALPAPLPRCRARRSSSVTAASSNRPSSPRA